MVLTKRKKDILEVFKATGGTHMDTYAFIKLFGLPEKKESHTTIRRTLESMVKDGLLQRTTVNRPTTVNFKGSVQVVMERRYVEYFPVGGAAIDA